MVYLAKLLGFFCLITLFIISGFGMVLMLLFQLWIPAAVLGLTLTASGMALSEIVDKF
jgi:hypothetical protein